VSQFEKIALNDDIKSWNRTAKCFIIYIMRLRMVCRALKQELKVLAQSLTELEENRIWDLISLELRPDGEASPHEIIFYHDHKWFVVTKQDLAQMLYEPHHIQFEKDPESRLKIQFVTPSSDISRCIQKSQKMTFHLKIQMQNGKNAIITSSSILKHHGYNAIQQLLKAIHGKEVYVEGLGDHMIYFNTHVSIDASIILYASDSMGVFPTGPILVCASCHANVKKINVESHLKKHDPFFSPEVLSAMKKTSIKCPNCPCWLEKIPGSEEEPERCNHLRCPKCTIAVCFRCEGIRHEQYESTYDPQTVKIDKEGKSYTDSFTIVLTRQNVIKQINVCPKNCKQNHNSCPQIKLKDGGWERNVCCGGHDILHHEMSHSAQSTRAVLEQMHLQAEEIEEAIRAQAMADAMRAERFAHRMRDRELRVQEISHELRFQGIADIMRDQEIADALRAQEIIDAIGVQLNDMELDQRIDLNQFFD
jgi:hypothetical protein